MFNIFKPRNRRRTLFITDLQTKFTIALMGLIVGISLILVTTLALLFKGKLTFFWMTDEIIKQIMFDSILPVAIIGIILFSLSLWAVILISHKIYGPLYRFNMYLKKLTSGQEAGELKFRTGDAMDGLKEVYNEIRKNLESTLHYNYEEMVDIFSKLQNILDKLHDKKIEHKELYNSLQNVCSRIAHALDITSDAIEPENK